MKKGKCFLSIWVVLAFLFSVSYSMAAQDEEKIKKACISCHEKISPGQVMDWRASKHAAEDISCADCHGTAHTSVKDAAKAKLPDEHVCAECHQEQFDQFVRGKHNLGWKALNALPVTHLEPDELMEGGKGCGGCHNMGIKSEEEKQKLHAQGYRYQNNSCDECHTRHAFSKKEALDPHACQQCHMGYDHPQWEMWSSSKHGTRYFAKLAGNLPEGAAAPKCQDCHMPNGDHENRTAWGFLGVRLPLPEDKDWAAAQVTILKALGVLDPMTGKPTARLQVVKDLQLARLTKEDFDRERNKMKQVCYRCHSKDYVDFQFKQADQYYKQIDMLLAEAINIVADLYKDGILKKRGNQAYPYPDFLYFMRTDYGAGYDKLEYIEQVLFEMYMKHRMRAYQSFFHINPDYAYWYGWAMMVKDLGEIKELAKQMRATHGK
ncbi:multiheme cytochrome family protein [Thermodesulfatator indicus DSM 15286]|uniref:Multiheme cytochrome family protein n=1 Tax=Thermodesulfatator indicus (strain DSM 15286 / JCM 11887 / CIR29812) TaxID=667014 RepID=F8AAN4_THEID|nr:multiheme c-type cytochrome [Thermodesulfatator indicus]AEH44306.1 multiheme cytochrome family protein [Thermodesulfatator indicus DSM 15286]